MRDPNTERNLKEGHDRFLRPPQFACSHQVHKPFYIDRNYFAAMDPDSLPISGIVRTTGVDFDGDRTDINNTFALIWAAALRAFGLASPYIVYEEHGFIEDDVDACHVLMRQCPLRVSADNLGMVRESLTAWTAFVFHMLNGVFHWHRALPLGEDNMAMQEQLNSKIFHMVYRHDGTPSDAVISRRRFPNFHYYSSIDNGLTVIRMPQTSISSLRQILSCFSPDIAEGNNARVLFANGIPNAIPYRVIDRARAILSIVGESMNGKLITLPIDSHCLFVGNRTVLAIADNYGRALYEEERKHMQQRQHKENRVFFSESQISWNLPLDPTSLEEMCADLLEREPGVTRVKLVGKTYDRDGGRDIMADWALPKYHDSTIDENNNSISPSPGTDITRTVVQVKSRSKTIGKQDVQDIRDTLDHHDSKGFLLIAHPRISSQLLDRLDKLRSRAGVLCDWWESRDIETKLRQHPDIARRYPNLLSIRSE